MLYQKLKIIALLFIAITVTSAEDAPKPIPFTPGNLVDQSATKTGAATEDERFKAFLRIANASAEAADKAAHAAEPFAEGQPLWFSTIGSATLAEPIEDKDGNPGARVLQTANIEEVNAPAGGRPLTIIPILAADSGLKNVKEFLDKRSLVQLVFEAHVLMVRMDEPISDEWLGLVVLRQAWHARNWITKPYKPSDSNEMIARDIEAITFQHRLAAAIGGKAYRDALERESSRLVAAGTTAKEDPAKGILRVYTAPRIGNYELNLNPIFGQALSPFESNTRATDFHVEATLQALNHGDAAKIFLKSAYIGQGHLPDDGSIARGEVDPTAKGEDAK